MAVGGRFGLELRLGLSLARCRFQNARFGPVQRGLERESRCRRSLFMHFLLPHALLQRPRLFRILLNQRIRFLMSSHHGSFRCTLTLVNLSHDRWVMLGSVGSGCCGAFRDSFERMYGILAVCAFEAGVVLCCSLGRRLGKRC